MKVRGIASILLLSLLLVSCSGSSGGSSSGTVAATTTPVTATATEVSVFGTADKISVAIAKPDQNTETVKAAASPLAGAAVTAIKSNGASAGSTTTAQDGTYTLLLPKGGTYVIKITSGNIVMKSVYAVGTANATINVNPGTTAAVVILEKKLSTTFDSGTAFSTAVNSVDVNATVTAIAATSGFTATANAVVNAVAANANPLTATTVTSAATTAATTATVTTASLIGTWTGSVTGSTTAVAWNFTATATTLTGPSCESSGSYTTSGSALTIAWASHTPSGCKNDTSLTGTYTISGKTLTLVITSGVGGTFSGISVVGTLFPIATNATIAGSATGAGQEMAVSAAYDGTNYLVGIAGDATKRNNIGTQRIDGSGTKVGPLILTGRTGGAPIAGFNGTTYLIAWADDALNTGTTWNEIIYGQVIDTAGTAGTPFAISTASNNRVGGVSVVCLGGRCSVMWNEKASKAVYGRDIYSTGTFVNAQFGIEGGTTTGAPGGEPAGVCDSTGKNCMAVYDIGTAIRASGTVAGVLKNTFTVATKAPVTAGCTNSNPARIAFDGTNYLVVWNDHSDCAAKPSWDILAQRMDVNGTNVGAAFQVNSANTKYAIYPTMAFDGSNFLVVWTDGRNDANKDNVCDASEGTCHDVRGQYISKAGALVGSEFIINNDAGEQFGFMAGFNAGKYLVLINTGVDFSTGAFGDVYGVFVTP